MNSVQLIGRPTVDPTPTATTASGTPTSLGLTTDRPGRNGTHYLTIGTCQGIAEIAVQHLSRGRRVATVGRLEHHEWTLPDGARHSPVEDVANPFVGLP